MKSINVLVKNRRKQLGMTKQALEKKSGVSRTTILFVERDGVQPTFSNAVALLEALNLELVVREKPA
jgi:DNA-binding XRE family transcriptional regulator